MLPIVKRMVALKSVGQAFHSGKICDDMEVLLLDAFGTLCEIQDRRNPYKPILKAWPYGVAGAYQALMTRDVPPTALAYEVGCSPETILRMEEAIRSETESMRLYPDVPAVLEAIKSRGLKWGIVSNLATPYAEPLLHLLPYVPDVCAWSFSVGYRKPEEGIYNYACKALGVAPSSVLMVGDSLENDYTTPKRLGMKAAFLKRSGNKEYMADCVENLTGILSMLGG